MVTPLVTLDCLRSVRVAVWHRLFAAFGYPSGLDRRDADAAGHDAIAAALDPPPGDAAERPAHPRELVVRLAELRDLDVWQARDALHDAAAAALVDTTDWPRDLGDAELAAWLIVESAARADLAGVVRCARVDLQQTTRPLPFRLYAARRPLASRLSPGAPDLAALAAEVDAWAAIHRRAVDTVNAATQEVDEPPKP